MRRGRWVLAGLGVSVGLLGLVLLTVPRLLGAHGWPVVAQVIALRGLIAAALLVLAGLLGAGLLARLLVRRRRSRSAPGPTGVVRGRTATRLLAGLTAVALVAATLQVVVLGTRGTAGIWVASPSGAEGRPDGAVVVLVLNTQDSVGAAELTDLVLGRQAHVVVLPETDSGTAAEVVRLAASAGRDLQVLATEVAQGSVAGTALLVDRRLGDYRTATPLPARLATFTARPEGPEGAAGRPGPPITAVHAFPPLPGTLADWRAEGTAVVLACEDEPGAIVAGDLNTTLDHPAFDHLDRCVDAAAEAGAAGVGTWPADRPRALGAPIDHVLVDGAAWTVHSATVLEPPPGTDHRAVEAVLLPRD